MCPHRNVFSRTSHWTQAPPKNIYFSVSLAKTYKLIFLVFMYNFLKYHFFLPSQITSIFYLTFTKNLIKLFTNEHLCAWMNLFLCYELYFV